MRTPLALATTLCCALLLPSIASAGEVRVVNDGGNTRVEFAGFPGEMNTVDVHFASLGRRVNVYDGTATLWTSAPECQVVETWRVQCTLLPEFDELQTITDDVPFFAYLGDGSDSFAPSPGSAPFRSIIEGGDDVDDITLGRNLTEFPSEAHGGEGLDVFRSETREGEGANLFFGDAGNDVFSTLNNGPDAIACGDGDDTVRADRADEVAGDCENVRR
jgi:hypothetical protein